MGGKNSVTDVPLEKLCGLAGLSDGHGVPESFLENDPSECGPCLSRAAPGDFDRDQDVDLEDFAHPQACFTGRGAPTSDCGCYDARLDGDTDVDGDDLGIFQGCMSGPDIPADVNCAN